MGGTILLKINTGLDYGWTITQTDIFWNGLNNSDSWNVEALTLEENTGNLGLDVVWEQPKLCEHPETGCSVARINQGHWGQTKERAPTIQVLMKPLKLKSHMQPGGDSTNTALI